MPFVASSRPTGRGEAPNYTASLNLKVKIRERILTEETIIELVTLVAEEIDAMAGELSGRLDVIDAELGDVQSRKGRTMVRYEFRIVEGKTQTDIERKMNELGQAGYRLASLLVPWEGRLVTKSPWKAVMERQLS